MKHLRSPHAHHLSFPCRQGSPHFPILADAMTKCQTLKTDKRKAAMMRRLEKFAAQRQAIETRRAVTTRPGLAEVLLSLARPLNEDASSKAAADVFHEIRNVAKESEAEAIDVQGLLDSMDPIARQPVINAFKFVFKALWESEQTANIAVEMTRETIRVLKDAAKIEDSPNAQDLRSLAQDLKEDASLKAAASVLKKIGKVAENMKKYSKEVKIMIRDIVVLRCLACIDPMDRQAFTNALKVAFDDQDLVTDVFLLAHHKLCERHGIRSFSSGNFNRKTERQIRRQKNRKHRARAQESGHEHAAAASSRESPEAKKVPLPAFVTPWRVQGDVTYDPFQTNWGWVPEDFSVSEWPDGTLYQWLLMGEDWSW